MPSLFVKILFGFSSYAFSSDYSTHLNAVYCIRTMYMYTVMEIVHTVRCLHNKLRNTNKHWELFIYFNGT